MKILVSHIVFFIPIILLTSCSNSVSFKTDEFKTERKNEIMAMIKSEKGDTSAINLIKDTKNQIFMKDGIVKDAKTAADIAFIYLNKIYGEKKINNELPLIVYPINGFWFVEGTFNMGNANGGVAEIIITKKDGKVIHITHGK
jgi:hypothetical protein